MVAPVPVSYCTPSIQGFAFREGVAQQLVVPPVIPLDTFMALIAKASYTNTSCAFTLPGGPSVKRAFSYSEAAFPKC